MSYYNYLFLPITDETESSNNDSNLTFFENEEGFENLVRLIGSEFVQFCDEKNSRKIVFKQLEGGTDALRPHDLIWNMNRDRKVLYSDPDCVILLSELDFHVNWSNLEKDIESTENSVSIYKEVLKEHGDKVVIYPC